MEKNFQGFPVSACKYEEEIDKFVYCPTGYGASLGKNNSEPIKKLCHHCFLRPCVVKEKWEDIMDFCEEDIMVFEHDDSEAMYFKMTDHLEGVLLQIFGARYTRNHAPPACVNELLSNYHGTKQEMEEENPDDELVAGAVDGNEYLLLTQES